MAGIIAPAQTTEYIVLNTDSPEGQETTITVTSSQGTTTHGFFECFMYPGSTDVFVSAIMFHFAGRSIGYSLIEAYKLGLVYEVTYAEQPIMIGGRVYEDI